MLGYRPIFCIVAKTPTVPEKGISHFPIGPKMKVINIKNETCQTKDPIKR